MQLLKICLILLLFTSLHGMGQDKIEWSSSYNLKKEDFKGIPPNTGTVQTVHFQSLIEYSYMTLQLVFANLNSNVKCSFIPSASWIDEGDNMNVLLRYVRVNWDLSELAARKLRKLFHENRLKLSVKTTEEFYEQVLKESAAIESAYSKETDFGKKDIEQHEWELKVKQLLDEYSDYCQTCKPPKRKK